MQGFDGFKTTILSAFAIICVVLWSGFAALADSPFKSDQFGFEVVFPEKPRAQAGVRNFASGPAQVIRFKSTGEVIRPALSLIIFERGAFSPEEITAALELSSERQVRQFNGSLVSSEDIVVDGYRGKETVLKGSHQGRTFFYRSQTYYAGNRQFILSVAAEDLNGVGKVADGYFASFHITD